MKHSEYQFTIRPLTDDEGGGYWIEYPDLKGCHSDGATIEEAIANGEDALQGWLEATKEMGLEIPKPQYSKYHDYSGQWRQRVPVPVHADLARVAEEKVSLNALVASFIAEGLGRRFHKQG